MKQCCKYNIISNKNAHDKGLILLCAFNFCNLRASLGGGSFSYGLQFLSVFVNQHDYVLY